jgi:hypothetical protein
MQMWTAVRFRHIVAVCSSSARATCYAAQRRRWFHPRLAAHAEFVYRVRGRTTSTEHCARWATPWGSETVSASAGSVGHQFDSVDRVSPVDRGSGCLDWLGAPGV